MSKHSMDRMKERYNLEISKKEEQDIINLLRNNDFIFCGSAENDPKHLKFAYVHYNNIPIKVLYYRSNQGGVKQIITAYPFDVDEYNNLYDEIKNKAEIKFKSSLEYAIIFLKKNGYIVYKRKATLN